jgi:hypothetical protein
MHRRVLAAARLAATAGIAGIAAWVSYWHMAGVAARYGESPSSAYLLPLSVDGLIIVGSVSLVELAGRIRGIETAAQKAAEAEAEAAARRAAAEAAAAAATVVAPVEPAPVPVPLAELAPTVRRPAKKTTAKKAAPKKVPAKAATRRPASNATPTRGAASRQRRPAAETAALAEAIEATHPDISRSELARQLGISVGRLASVRREMRDLQRAA